TAVLLRAAPAADPPAGRGLLRGPLPRRPLDVRVADAGPLSVHASARLGILPAGPVCHPDRARSGAVSRLPMGCGRQGAAERLVVEVSLGRSTMFRALHMLFCPLNVLGRTVRAL